ncbi:HIT-like protein [Hypomontagnella submonticulosa]|nr:HIT-like protein [Hypomontagnella submonticulosa]
MEAIKAIFHYLTHLEWTQKVQTDCIFCDRNNFEKNIVYEDDELIAINNRRKAGSYHWLIMPKSHRWRDIEGLTAEDAALVHSMVALKNQLVKQSCPAVPSANVHIGFHRGRRILLGNVYWPDIISIHHLHMHVIVEPHFWSKFFKYPPWLPLMWKSEEQVVRELVKKSKVR